MRSILTHREQAEMVAIFREASFGEEVMEHLKEHPGGVTLRHHIGDEPKDGYMVSLPHAEKKQPFADLSAQEIDAYHDAHPEIEDNWYGGWHEGPDFYHDVSENIPDSYDAARAAVSGNQLAVFDSYKRRPNGEPLDDAYIQTDKLVNSGPASALGWTMAKRRGR